jgi:medium-chain acyl-[acyl-carrier-protein] hydrolase
LLQAKDSPSEPRITLFCIPHAGGGASAYRNWANALSPQIAVKVLQLPGREGRFREPVLTELDAVLDDLLRAVVPDTAWPFAFLGHSMGALLAFELSQRLRDDTGREPTHLFVSACRAPHLPQVAEPCSSLPKREFVAAVTRCYGGIPAAILADQDFLDAILPSIRADFAILERYRVPERLPLDCPISAFGGRQDSATPQSTLEAWRKHTTGAFNLEILEGGHFYIQSKQSFMAEKILGALKISCVEAGDIDD